MFVVAVVTSGLLAALSIFSASQKLGRSAPVVESYRRVGVEARHLPLLATALLAGGVGVVVGLAWPPVGIAASAGLAVYFVLAVGAHVRHRALRTLGPPLVALGLATTVLVLRMLTM